MSDRVIQGLQFVWRYNPNAEFNTEFPFTNTPANHDPASYNYQELHKQVSASINHFCRDAGNVIPWVMQDLTGPNAEHERELLPKLDYVHAYYDISDLCKGMLTEKIERAQRQHAHDLANADMIDIKVTWFCGPNNASHTVAGYAVNIVVATKEDADMLQVASQNQYRMLDWDKEHYKQPELTAKQKQRQGMPFGGYELGQSSSQSSSQNMPLSPMSPTPEPHYRGGFYAVVPCKVYRHLVVMAQDLDLTITTILEPKSMTAAELAEMKAYRSFRRLPKAEYEREGYFRAHGVYPETPEERDRRILRGREESLEKRLAAKSKELEQKEGDGQQKPGSASMWNMLRD